MLIGKLIKPCKIVIYEQQEDGSEVESFTMLKLSLAEAYQLLQSAGYENEELMLDNSIVIKYSGNDQTHQLWKDLAVNHCKENPKDFFDVSKKFDTKIPGSSCLVRDAKNHIIRIAKREGNDEVTINRLCIDDTTRERFFADSKRCTMFKTMKKYAIDTQDLEIYTYWSKYMNSMFMAQSKEASK